MEWGDGERRGESAHIPTVLYGEGVHMEWNSEWEGKDEGGGGRGRGRVRKWDSKLWKVGGGGTDGERGRKRERVMEVENGNGGGREKGGSMLEFRKFHCFLLKMFYNGLHITHYKFQKLH